VVLPDFFVIGAPKAGTTALHVALAAHPHLFLSSVKEPKFFLCDGPPPEGGGPGDAQSLRERIWRREEYEALFADAPAGALRGESTPFYLYDPDAQRRLQAAVPHARLIAVVRDPVDRAHSNWAHLWSAGLEPEGDFVTACRLEQRRAAAGWAPFWRYLDLGRYGAQLQRLFGLFPREQVLVLRYRDVLDRPSATLDRICLFLGVATGVVREIPAQNVTTQASDSVRNRVLSAALRAGVAVDHWLPAPALEPARTFLSRRLQTEQRRRVPLTPHERAALVGHFADDITLLEQLTGEDLTAWRRFDLPFRLGRLAPSGPIGTAWNSIDRPLGREPHLT
jgi:hypothetical protein